VGGAASPAMAMQPARQASAMGERRMKEVMGPVLEEERARYRLRRPEGSAKSQ
jgi:hypothetical protein